MNIFRYARNIDVLNIDPILERQDLEFSLIAADNCQLTRRVDKDIGEELGWSKARTPLG